jgi:thiol-disulfide isomerase/thioredoxin
VRLLSVFSLCVVALFCSCQSPRSDVAEGRQAPGLEISDAGTGQKIDLGQYKGRVMFINFWATWCAPCREETPSIEALHRELGHDGRFVMLTILYKDSPNTANEYMKSNGYTFPVCTDREGASAKGYGVTGVPETYLVDKRGVLRKKIIGSLDWSSSEARTFINTLLLE